MKKDSARVIKENNALHVQIIQQAEQHSEQQMENYQRVKELEKEISELSFWKHQAQSRLEVTEKENASIKERLKDVMNLGELTLLVAYEEQQSVAPGSHVHSFCRYQRASCHRSLQNYSIS